MLPSSGTEHVEIAYRERVGKGMIEAGIYQDVISDAAVTAIAPDHLQAGGQLLPDLFSRSSTLNGGRHFSRGYRVSYARKIADQLEAALGYGNTAVVSTDQTQLATTDLGELRSGLGVERAHMVSASVSAEVPRAGTRFVSGYQWLSRQGVLSADHVQRLRRCLRRRPERLDSAAAACRRGLARKRWNSQPTFATC